MRGDSKRGASAWRLLPTLLAALLPGANGQESRPATENLTALCRLWGLVKYHHPALATGDIDWDAALVEALPAVEQARGEEELGLALGRYAAAGIEDIMALRGDPPAGDAGFAPPPHGFEHAADLVAFIKREHPSLGVGVAGYPQGHHETPNRLREMDHLKAKVDAGADYICTQMFFDNHIFYDFCDRCEAAGIRVPIIAGIMPVTSLATMRRMSELALGVHIPGKLQKAIGRMSSRGSVARIGVHWATEQVRDLLDHRVAGIHLYTLNQSRATLQIVETLGVL